MSTRINLYQPESTRINQNQSESTRIIQNQPKLPKNHPETFQINPYPPESTCMKPVSTCFNPFGGKNLKNRWLVLFLFKDKYFENWLIGADLQHKNMTWKKSKTDTNLKIYRTSSRKKNTLLESTQTYLQILQHPI